ncbi:alpha,alpha-trehalose phosphorylase [Thermoflexales bacterium]|nr:alpha,alpha-trehalose phosphorylase [Thermoflexales bacterium]
MTDLWAVTHTQFDPQHLQHAETIFTIGNGYLSTRGAFEEGYPGDERATLLHGVFDDAPMVMTELVNAPDWLALTIRLNGERFSLAQGTLEAFEQTLDLKTGVLTRTVRWRSPAGDGATLKFERFASLANEHLLLLRCTVTPEFEGLLEIHAALDAHAYNEHGAYRLAHWHWLDQGERRKAAYLLVRTHGTGLKLAGALRCQINGTAVQAQDMWHATMVPTQVVQLEVKAGQPVVAEKFVALVTSRDVEVDRLVDTAVEHVTAVTTWEAALAAQTAAWQAEWERCNVIVEGDDEAQLALRFNLFQMLIAAPRHDDRVNIGAKTLSGFGYCGHSFWDTEIFMLPLFSYTSPHIARNLLTYRWRNLPGARAKARANGFEGAQFPWESAATGEEVTPTWVPHFADRTQLVRIWTGDIELHISADIAYAAQQYWQVTGDDEWFIQQGAELILDTAKFWASRAEWHPDRAGVPPAAGGVYEYRDVIGPDEYHEHVDNNFYTNRMAQWNLQTALHTLAWLKNQAPDKAQQLIGQLDLSEQRLAHWQAVIDKLYLPVQPNGLIEQFDGYFQLREIDAAALEPRSQSFQQIFGIAGANEVQGIKQPDVLILLHLLRSEFSAALVRVNYDYYTPRTDHTYGSSLGPAIMAIMACEVGLPADAYEHFRRAVRADLHDVRGNADDGIHAASAAGTWQVMAFGFAGLRLTPDGWHLHPRLPQHWKRLSFKFCYRGEWQTVDLTQE